MDEAVTSRVDVSTLQGSAGTVDDTRLSLFTRLFGVALVAHVVGNWFQPDIPAPVGLVNLGAAGIAVALLIRPSRRLLLLSSAFVIVSVLLEMPITGNHWVLAGLVAAAILVTGAKPERLFPTARVILLVFYAFAAFAKLNSGFFDPTASCAVFYANQSLTGLGLPSLATGGWLARTIIWATVAIEVSVPLALVWRHSRYFGVLLATTFHTLVSFDLDQHFYDFTAVLLALFFLFLPDGSTARISAQITELQRLAPFPAGWIAALVGILALVAVFPLTPLTAVLLSRVPFLFWIPFSLLWVAALVRARASGTSFLWRTGFGGALVVVVAVLNGLTPYFEVKTAYSFNMYANLETAQGRSNHYLVPSTWPLRTGYDGPVEILESSDDGLNAYREEGYLVAYPQLRRYLSARPETSLSYRRFGEVVTVAYASSIPELVDPGPWWWRFLPLRAIDMRDPPRCQASFLPAL